VSLRAVKRADRKPQQFSLLLIHSQGSRLLALTGVSQVIVLISW
jgi:hypothetical protein